MSFRNALQTLTVPDGAGPGDARLVIVGPDDMPEPLKSDGFQGAIIMFTDNDVMVDTYQYIAWQDGTFSIDPFFDIGNVIEGAFQLNADGSRAVIHILGSFTQNVNYLATFLGDVTMGGLLLIGGDDAGLHLNLDNDFSNLDFRTLVQVGPDQSYTMSRGYRRLHSHDTDLNNTGVLTDWFSLDVPGVQLGRYYLVDMSFAVTSSIANDTAIIFVTDVSNVVLPFGVNNTGAVRIGAATISNNGGVKAVFTPSADGSFTVKFRAQRFSGAGTVTFQRAMVEVLDVTDFITTG